MAKSSSIILKNINIKPMSCCGGALTHRGKCAGAEPKPQTAIIYVARDKSGELYQFSEQPKWSEVDEMWESTNEFEYECIDMSKYPEIHPGECYEAEITLKRKI